MKKLLLALLLCTAVSLLLPATASAGQARSSSSAATLVKVTLKVDVLPTQMGINGEAQPTYPASVTLRIAPTWSDQVAAYGAAGIVVLAPRDWTAGGARIGADGSALLTLHGTASAAIQGSLTYFSDGADVGGSWMDGAEYFPWLRAHWASSGFGSLPTPKARSGLRIDFIGKRLISYTIATAKKGAKFQVSGVAHTSLMPGKRTYPSFDRLEVKLPASDHGLAIDILNYFVDRYHHQS